MSVQGPFKVDCVELFPQGLGIISEVDSLDDFDKSTKTAVYRLGTRTPACPCGRSRCWTSTRRPGRNLPGEDRG
jgi:hypothetical protein